MELHIDVVWFYPLCNAVVSDNGQRCIGRSARWCVVTKDGDTMVLLSGSGVSVDVDNTMVCRRMLEVICFGFACERRLRRARWRHKVASIV